MVRISLTPIEIFTRNLVGQRNEITCCSWKWQIGRGSVEGVWHKPVTPKRYRTKTGYHWFAENMLIPHWSCWKQQDLKWQWFPENALRWRHNELDGVSDQQPHDCLLNRLFGSRSKKTSKLRVTGLCAGNSPGTGEFPAQMASNAENVSIWWRHHGCSSSLAPEWWRGPWHS